MRRGFSLIELLIVIAIILVIITVAVLPYQRAQTLAREMAASKAVQTIQTDEVIYPQYGHFASSLRELGPPDAGPSSAAAAGLISGALASGALGGYKFTLTGTADTYAITALPVAFGSSGVKSFFLDQSGILHATEGQEPATSASPEFAK